MRTLSVTVAMAAILALSATVPVAAAPNIYGTSGLIEVPDDRTFPVGTVSPAYHVVTNIDFIGFETDLNFYTIGVGITPNLSVSGGIVDNSDSEALLNAKYRLAGETADRPSITVGVIDALSELNDDPGLYIVFAKNLTRVAEEVVDGESRPLRGYLGFGTGILEGIFLGLEWTLTPRLAAMAEYVDEGLGRSDVNVGVRYALTNELRVDLALVDLDDFSAGISYNVIRF